jgi:hypothetical protein
MVLISAAASGAGIVAEGCAGGKRPRLHIVAKQGFGSPDGSTRRGPPQNEKRDRSEIAREST